MGLGGCCTFHEQLSGTMEGKNASSVRSPPHPASLPLRGMAGTESSEGRASGKDRLLRVPVQTVLLSNHVPLPVHHYSLITSFIHLLI